MEVVCGSISEMINNQLRIGLRKLTNEVTYLSSNKVENRTSAWGDHSSSYSNM